MAETQRTLTALLSLLADNTTGDISPEDIRDIVETLRPSNGVMYIASGDTVETVISTVSTYTKVLGTTTLETTPAARDFTMPADNRLQYTGTVNRLVHVVVAVSFVAAGNSKTYHFRLAQNGTTKEKSEVQRKVGTGSDVGALCVVGVQEMAPNDYLELFVSNETDTTNLTIQRMHLACFGQAL